MSEKTGLRGSPRINERIWVGMLAAPQYVMCALSALLLCGGGCAWATVRYMDPQGNVLCEAASSVVGTSESTIRCGEVEYTTKGGGMSEETGEALGEIAEGAARGAAGALVPNPGLIRVYDAHGNYTDTLP